MANESPRGRIDALLTDLWDDLEWVVERAEAVLPGHRQGFYGALREAWRDLAEDVRGVHVALEEVDRETLRAHGLTGSQLDLKVTAIEARREALELIREEWERIERLDQSVRRTLIRDAVASYFRTLDRVLESILDALGAPGALAEFKDLLEQSTEG